jgi:hypothetical protein
MARGHDEPTEEENTNQFSPFFHHDPNAFSADGDLSVNSKYSETPPNRKA